MFDYYKIVDDPRVVKPMQSPNPKLTEAIYEDDILKGRFLCVKPSNAKEWRLLRFLEPHVDKWALAAGHGEGIVVRPSAIGKAHEVNKLRQERNLQTA